MTMKTFLILAVVLFTCTEINSLPNFRHGRRVGGNLGQPYSDKKQVEAVNEEWFNQTLDHFNPTDERTWQQRFFSNDQFFNGSGPVFLMIGGEGAASPAWMVGGNWVVLAIKYGALLFQVEHRFYGESHPTDDLSNENLVYLTSQQALADLATFIVATNQRYNLTSDTKWIVFGGSYSGSLAAWARAKYPHLIQGAVAASGPVLAQVDFRAYLQVVAESLATYSDDCVTAIEQAVEQVGVLLKRDIGQDNLNQLFSLCQPIQNSVNSSQPDISNFYEVIADNFAGVVQYNKDVRTGTSLIIEDVCELMVNETIGAPIDRLSAVNSLILDNDGEECLDYDYGIMIEEIREISWDSDAVQGGWRQWLYQTCTEFGFYQTSTHERQVFGDQFPIEFFIQQCADIYGENYTAAFLDGAIERTNTIYGGLGIDVTNVVFTHGSIDPWHALGILEDVNDQAPAIYIEGTAHCADMYTPSEGDLPQLVAAREEIDVLVGSWLGVSKNTKNN